MNTKGITLGKRSFAMKKHLILLVAVTMFTDGLLAREAPPKLQIDVDFFDNLETVRPYCGSNWIDRFFADCKAHGVKRVTWRARRTA